jgi:hypothetical protein
MPVKKLKYEYEVGGLQYEININVRDTTASHVHVDRRSMHVVKHHDDFFFWKKYNNYTYSYI